MQKAQFPVLGSKMFLTGRTADNEEIEMHLKI